MLGRLRIAPRRVIGDVAGHGGILAVAILLAACGGAPAERSGSVHVRMTDNQFHPRVVRVPVGGTIRFTNDGRNPHNAIAVDRSWSATSPAGEERIDPGGIAEVRIDRPGIYQYYCSYHATPDGRWGMVGVLVVGRALSEALAARPDARPQPVREPTGVVRRVPEMYATIQAAVDAANPGDLILIGPGVYRERVTVTTPSLVIRGTDRNRVIIDGEFRRENGIEILGADGVAVENLTVRNHLLNGVYWTGVTGYRASYVTAYNNGDYGLYAFDSVDGVFEYSYASGSPDSGFYIGQCFPCRAIINGVIAENNALGYSGTNAGGDLYIVSSVWRNNMAGIVPNSLDTELYPPQRAATIVGNLIVANNNREAPAKALQYPAFGNGVVIAGGAGNVVERNVILNHVNHGVLVTPNVSANLWFAIGNRVAGNVVRGSGRADLAVGGLAGPGNCFAENSFRRSIPVGLQRFYGCGRWRLPLGADLSTTMRLLGANVVAQRGRFPHGRVEAQPPPPPQPQMPGGVDAPVRPAHDVFANYRAVDLSDLARIPLPAEAASYLTEDAQENRMMGVAIQGPGFWPLFFELYGYLLPTALLAAWLALSFWDLARREDLGRGGKLAWIAVILLVPFLGVIAYHAFAAKLPGWLRLAVVGGGIGAYVLIVGVGLLFAL
jgi:plastocyanin